MTESSEFKDFANNPEVPAQTPEASEETGESVDTHIEAVESTENSGLFWRGVAEAHGLRSVDDMFQGGFCLLCKEGGNDHGEGVGTETPINRNNVRGQLEHLDDSHASMKN